MAHPLLLVRLPPYIKDGRRSSLQGRRDGDYGALKSEERGEKKEGGTGRKGGNAGWRQQEDRKGKTQNRERIRGVSRP